MQPVYPVILCGGSGTRLWPLSRKSFPKQFVKLAGDLSLFQACVQRLRTSAHLSLADPIVVTTDRFRFIVKEQLETIDITPDAILIEPEARNTAPSVLAAAVHLAQIDHEALMLVAPSDHVLQDADALHQAISIGVQDACAGRMVTFGVTPDRAETGYGYLRPAKPASPGQAVPLAAFIEKPSEKAAQLMLAQGNHFWNSGIFLFRAADVLAAFEDFEPDMFSAVRDAVHSAKRDLGFLHLDPGLWKDVQEISFDHAVMERASAVSVVAMSTSWKDLGCWPSVRELSPCDPNGVATSGPVTAIDCRNSLLRSETPGLELVGLGVENLIAVAMPDAVLIADLSRGQDVRQVVSALRSKNVDQADRLPVDYRPWGNFETLTAGDRFQVKRIVVKPGGALSLQSHHHRAEHWIIVHGTARVTVDDRVQLLSENQSVYVPLGAKHRLENPGRVDTVLIEVQTGCYLGEDDIVRYEDAYHRSAPKALAAE